MFGDLGDVQHRTASRIKYDEKSRFRMAVETALVTVEEFLRLEPIR
jgi:hypothetical protein